MNTNAMFQMDASLYGRYSICLQSVRSGPKAQACKYV